DLHSRLSVQYHALPVQRKIIRAGTGAEITPARSHCLQKAKAMRPKKRQVPGRQIRRPKQLLLNVGLMAVLTAATNRCHLSSRSMPEPDLHSEESRPRIRFSSGTWSLRTQ